MLKKYEHEIGKDGVLYRGNCLYCPYGDDGSQDTGHRSLPVSDLVPELTDIS